MKKLLLIVNPCAGTKKAARNFVGIVSAFNRAGWSVNTYVTGAPGDGAIYVKNHAQEADVVVCCGGDGTFNETVNGLLGSGVKIPIGYIPAGSTNDFATSLKLSADILQAAQDIIEGQPSYYDVGLFGNRYFSYVASFGAFTRASYRTMQNVKNALGHTAYLLEGIQEISQIRKEHVRLELDGEVVEDDFLFGAICNSTSVGGILTLDPRQVDLCDGKFEVLLVRAPKDLGEIGECIQAVQKQTYNCRMMTFRSASQIKITANPKMTWTLDGEREDGHEEVLVQNLHKAISLIHAEKL